MPGRRYILPLIAMLFLSLSGALLHAQEDRPAAAAGGIPLAQRPGQAARIPHRPALPSRHLLAQVATLESQVEALRQTVAREEDRDRALALSGSIAVRLMAGDLLRLAAADAAGVHDRTALAGLVLLHQAADMDELLLNAALTLESLKLVASPSAAELAQMKRLHEGLEQLASRARSASPPVALTSYARVAPLMRAYFAPARDLLEITGRNPIQIAWPPSGPWRSSVVDGGVQLLTLEDLDTVEARLGRLPSSGARAQLEAIMLTLRGAVLTPSLEIKATEAFAELRPAIELLDTLAEAQWLGDLEKRGIDGRLHRALAIYNHPRTRPTGRAQLAAVARYTAPLRQTTALAALPQQGSSIVERIRPAWSAAVALEDERLSAQLLDWLETVSGAVLAYRDLARPQRMDTDLRLTYAGLNNEFTKYERELELVARRIAQTPGAVDDPALMGMAHAMRRIVADMQLLAVLPGHITAANMFGPQPATGISNRAAALSEALLRPRDRRDAAAILRAFVRQMTLWQTLPSAAFDDAPQDAAVHAAWQALPRYDEVALRCDALRRTWATAWATGRDPQEARRLMLTPAQLRRAMIATAAFAAHAPPPVLLNRWAAVEFDLPWYEQAGARTHRAARTLCDHLLDREFDDGLQLDRIYDTIDRAYAVARMMELLRQALPNMSGGASGALSQLLTDPLANALLADAVDVLAAFCRAEMALRDLAPAPSGAAAQDAAAAADADADAEVQALRHYAAGLARQLLARPELAEPQ